jgi:peptidoglycan/LPS O-acetylase OafA/YrhL
MHEEGSLRPTVQGTALAKDVWTLAIGSALVLDALGDHVPGRKRSSAGFDAAMRRPAAGRVGRAVPKFTPMVGGTVAVGATEDATPVAGTPRPVLERQPALDGLRGVAVAAVVAFHLERLPGGFLGVDLFFVLSGFLITSLLLVESEGRGAIDLGRFWSRRARRLLPALFLLLGGLALLVAVKRLGLSPGFRGDALSTLGYVANWHAMAREIGYWDLFAQPSPLDHMWSLAIEEQFYLLWPPLVLGLLLLAGRRAGGGGRRLVGGVAVVGAAASFAVLALTWTATDTSRAYYGTDARVGPTLLGAALAAVVTVGRRRPPVPTDTAVSEDRMGPVDGGGSAAGPPSRTGGWWAPAVGTAALAFLLWSFAEVRGTEPAYYRGGLAAFALAAVVVVAVVVRGRAGPLGVVLGLAPLRGLGIISYGVYLWHWPVIVYATRERTGLDGWVLDAACVALTLALAIASFMLVERPVRRGALRGGIRGLRAPLALGGAVAAIAALVVVGTAGAPTSADVTVVAGPAGEASDFPSRSVPESVPRRGARILLVGDSGPIFLGPALAAEAERDGATAAYDSQYGCTPLVPEGKVRSGDQVLDTPICHDVRRDTWAAIVERFDPDVVVYYLAAITELRQVRMGDQWVGDCDPAYDTYLQETLTEDADVLGARGATVVFTTTPLSAVAAVAPQGDTSLDCRNATYRTVAAHRARTQVLDLRAEVQRAVDAGQRDMWRDPIHLSDYGAARVSQWLVPASIALVDPERLTNA